MQSICSSVLLIFLNLTIVANSAYSATRKKTTIIEVPSNDEPQLSIGEGLSDKIYQKSTEGSSENDKYNFSLYSAAKIIFPSQFELKNDYFRIDYASNLKSLYGISVGPQLEILRFDNASAATFLRFGYYYAQGIYSAEVDSDLVVKDAIELQWMPVQSGLELSSRSFTKFHFIGSLTAAVGIDWINQSGQLDGMNQSYIIPRYEVGPTLSAFGSPAGSSNGFEGVTLSVQKYKSFATKQQNNGWATDIGAKYAF